MAAAVKIRGSLGFLGTSSIPRGSQCKRALFVNTQAAASGLPSTMFLRVLHRALSAMVAEAVSQARG